MSDSAGRLFLLDGYSIIFRAFYAIRDLSTSKGEPTNAVYGFINMVRKILREEKPELVGVALDIASSDASRKERFEHYKANRKPMPEDLRPQISSVRRAIEAFRIPILEQERHEADDVLGTLGRQAVDAGYEVVLVSADKDLMQLVASGISLYHTGREKLYDAALVEEDFGVPPDRVVDVLALMGDSIDNVPGVPGIGEKGARNLIREHGSLERLLEHRGEIKRKSYREGLENHRDQALLSKELVTIHTDLPLAFDASSLRHQSPDPEALRELYRELEFYSLLKELDREVGAAATAALEPAVEAISAEAWAQATAELAARVHLAVIGDATPVGLAVADASGKVVLGDFRRPGIEEACRESLDRWLADPERALVGHDLKEVLRLSPIGATTRAQLVDTMLMAYLLRSALRDFSFEEVCLERLDHRALSPKEAGWERGSAPLPGDSRLLGYAGERVFLAQQLCAQMERELREESVDGATDEGTLHWIYHQLEEPLTPVLLGMEEAGVLLDVGFLAELSEQLNDDVDRLEAEIYELAGERFNINSPQQLGVILFEKLGYPVVKRTRKTKSYSTGAETLEQLAAQGYDLPERMLRYRELSKLKSTYVDALPSLVAEDGRLHTRFNQAVAATGRLSSANPNLQNIPIRTELGQQIRKAFRAPSGSMLLVADYSQIELRVLAHIAGEEALMEAFRAGEDIHRSTAATVFGVAPDLVSADQRRAAKVINFGIIYGMSPFGLGQTLGIKPKEAEGFIRAYFERFPQVRVYTEETVERARREGRVETLYGRHRWLPDIQSRNWNVRENARRMAINARIQGTAADLLKLAMIAVDARLRQRFPTARLILTVHDELVLEVPAADVETVADLVKSEMEGVAQLQVPLVVEMGWGESWFDAKT
jgi:DNA polymerase-1